MFSVIKTTSMDKEGSLCLPIQNSGEGFLHIFLSYVIHCLLLMSNGKDFCLSICIADDCTLRYKNMDSKFHHHYEVILEVITLCVLCSLV